MNSPEAFQIFLPYARSNQRDILTNIAEAREPTLEKLQT
jgi:hypothetical protein